MGILQMSLSASVLIVAVVMIRALTLHKLPKKTFLILWGVVVCRLLIPFSIPSQFSFYTGLNRIIHTFARKTAISPTAGILNPTNMQGVGDGTGTFAVVSILPIVWLIGMCICALFFIVAYIKCHSEFKMSLPVESDFAASWLREHALHRPVQIRQSDRIKAPLTYGVFCPVVLLPRGIDWTDETKLRYIFAHEFTHIRRFDTLAKLVLTAAVCVHWFNPFVWLMCVLANRDIELSCDEAVVRTFGETTKSAYALTLIGLEEKKSLLTPLVNNFSKNAIEERIVSIMKFKRTSSFCIVCAVCLVIGVTTVFATSFQSNNHNTDLPKKFSSQYINELAQGHHTGDLDPQNVFLTFISENKYKLEDFKLQVDESMKKTYVYPAGNIEIQLTAYDVETSRGDVVRVWDAQQFLYHEF